MSEKLAKNFAYSCKRIHAAFGSLSTRIRPVQNEANFSVNHPSGEPAKKMQKSGKIFIRIFDNPRRAFAPLSTRFRPTLKKELDTSGLWHYPFNSKGGRR